MANKGNYSKSDKIFYMIAYVFLAIILLVVAYPLYFVIISSISDPTAVSRGAVRWFPTGINFDGYMMVFKRDDVVRSFINALYYTFLGTAINLVVTIPAAYSMSRRDLKGKKVIMIFFMVTMFISGGLIPTYIVIQRLHMIDTVWALVIPGAISIYNLIVAMTFFRNNLPHELLEAATIDGCNNFNFFFRIALPLSSAIIAIMVLYYGVGHWNSYFSAMIYMTSPNKWPLQLVLRTILVQNAQQADLVKDVVTLQKQQMIAELMKYSLIIISSVPILFVYPFIQKHFVKGVMIGSLKG